MGKFEIKIGKDDQFYFSLVASNGQNILQGEAYTTKAACLNGIESVRKNSQRNGSFESNESTNGKYYFILKATNGQTVGKSQMYESEASCKNGIESVIKNAPEASIVEIT